MSIRLTIRALTVAAALLTAASPALLKPKEACGIDCVCNGPVYYYPNGELCGHGPTCADADLDLRNQLLDGSGNNCADGPCQNQTLYTTGCFFSERGQDMAVCGFQRWQCYTCN